MELRRFPIGISITYISKLYRYLPSVRLLAITLYLFVLCYYYLCASFIWTNAKHMGNHGCNIISFFIYNDMSALAYNILNVIKIINKKQHIINSLSKDLCVWSVGSTEKIDRQSQIMSERITFHGLLNANNGTKNINHFLF